VPQSKVIQEVCYQQVLYLAGYGHRSVANAQGIGNGGHILEEIMLGS